MKVLNSLSPWSENEMSCHFNWHEELLEGVKYHNNIIIRGITARNCMTLCAQKLKMRCARKSDATAVHETEGHIQTCSSSPFL